MDMWSQGLATGRARELGGDAWRSSEWHVDIGRALFGYGRAPSTCVAGQPTSRHDAMGLGRMYAVCMLAVDL